MKRIETETTVSKPPRFNRSDVLLIIFTFPILGVILGGIYSWPAMKLTKERDPWLTLILACCLAATILVFGVCYSVPIIHSIILWGISVFILLLARVIYGSLGHSLECFGIVHAFTVVIAYIHGMISVAFKN